MSFSVLHLTLEDNNKMAAIHNGNNVIPSGTRESTDKQLLE